MLFEGLIASLELSNLCGALYEPIANDQKVWMGKGVWNKTASE